jgi:hypothetical protein
MIAYFGEVIKMCANISYLMMTLNRYLLVGNDHASWLVKIAKLEFKWVIAGSVVFSALINIGHGWEYQAVEDLMIWRSYQISNFYNNLNDNSYSDYPQASQSVSYFIYSIFYFLINFGFFFLLNTSIEVKIVRRMHKELKDKRERISKMHTRKVSLSAVNAASNETSEGKLSKENEDKVKMEEDFKKERKVIKMVVLNGVFNGVLRAPDMLFWMENQNMYSSVDVWVSIGRYMPGFVNFLADIGYLTYILTFTTNFFIFYKFNKNFHEAVVFWNSSAKKPLIAKK